METDQITSSAAGSPAQAPAPSRPDTFRRVVMVLLAVSVLSLLVLPLAANLLAATTSSQDVYRGITRVELDLSAPGDVEIVGNDGDEVTVDHTVRSFLGRTTTVDHDHAGTTLRLRTRCLLRIVGSPGCGAGYTLRVPTDTVIVGVASNGSVRMAAVDGEIDLSTSNGSVTVEGGQSAITLRSSNGTIELDGTRSGRIELETSNGDISLVSEAAPDTIIAGTSNGRIDIVIPADAPPYAVDAETSNGQTDIAIATDPSASRTIDARTSNGDISVSSAPNIA